MKYSCNYIIHLGCLMGFTTHFYITFGTNLLTQSPVPVSVFPLFQCFAEKEYQTESKRNETFRKVIFGKKAIQETWSARQGINEEATRQRGAPSTLVTTSWLFWLELQVSWMSSGPRKIIMMLYSVWTPLGIPFLQSSKSREKQKLALGSRLIG